MIHMKTFGWRIQRKKGIWRGSQRMNWDRNMSKKDLYVFISSYMLKSSLLNKSGYVHVLMHRVTWFKQDNSGRVSFFPLYFFHAITYHKNSTLWGNIFVTEQGFMGPSLGQTPSFIFPAVPLFWRTWIIMSDSHSLSHFTDAKTTTK